jgi:hypothetical protein
VSNTLSPPSPQPNPPLTDLERDGDVFTSQSEDSLAESSSHLGGEGHRVEDRPRTQSESVTWSILIQVSVTQPFPLNTNKNA